MKSERQWLVVKLRGKFWVKVFQHLMELLTQNYEFRVLETRNESYPKDSIIFGQLGWQTHSIFNPANNKDSIQTYVLPSFGKLSPSLGLGALGMPG